MKKLLIAGGVLSSAVASFAEGTSVSTPADIVTTAKTALESLMTTALPIVGALVVSGITLWGAFKLVRLVMKAFGFGTR